jgi:hypothetical protein
MSQPEEINFATNFIFLAFVGILYVKFSRILAHKIRKGLTIVFTERLLVCGGGGGARQNS